MFPTEKTVQLEDGVNVDLIVHSGQTTTLDPSKCHHYRNISVEAGARLTTKPWDGKAGGLLRPRAAGLVKVERHGSIDVSGCGHTDSDVCSDGVDGNGRQVSRYGDGGGGHA